MLHLIPRHVPPLSIMLDDIGRPAPAALAKTLHVHERTVRRWMATDRAPRPVQLTLFWLTRWGQGEVNARAVNDARLYAGLVGALRDEKTKAEHQVHRLLKIGDFGSANDPMNGNQTMPARPAAQLNRPMLRIEDSWTIDAAAVTTGT